ncbi:MAG: shikimate kinase [Chlamydiia bacterium]|nr:shikimate kinase [Chlamydiia bacterium]
MMRYFIVGLPGSGKTTVGRLLAARLGLKFIDLDEIVSRKDKTVRELYRELGDKGFRELENLALDMLEKGDVIISLGGGTLNSKDNREKVALMGKVIYLKEKFETVYERLPKDGLPAYLDKKDPKGSFLALAKTRAPIYEKAATLTVELKGRSPDEIVEDIIHGIE